MQKQWSVHAIGADISYHLDAPLMKPPNITHCHDTYEILYVIDGRGRYIVEGVTYEMRPGTLILISPLAYHCVEVEAEASYERCVANFSKEILVPEAAELLERVREAVFYSSTALFHILLGAFERLELSSELPPPGRDAYVRTVLSEILILMSVHRADGDGVDHGELGARVIRYLNEHIDKDLNLDKIAKHFFVSKYYLCRAFKKHNGVSIHGYLTHKRVMYAKQLIENGETASGAAYRVGFGDYSAFYRAYVKYVGCSPLAGQKRRSSS